MECANEFIKIDTLKREEIHEKYKNQIIDGLKTYNRIGCVLPTGTGKSYGIIRKLCNELDNVLVLVNRLSLKEQYYIYDKNIKVKTYQSLLYLKDDIEFNSYDYIICDEAHHICHNNKWGKSLNNLLIKYNIKVIGFTATDNRSDGINVINNFFNEFNTMPIYITDAINMNILPEINYITALAEIDDNIKSQIVNKLSEIERYEFENILNVPNILKEYIYGDRLNNLKVLFFVSRVDYIEQAIDICKKWFEEAFPKYNINCYSQSYKNTKLENTNQMKEFTAKHRNTDIDIMFGVDMFGEGVHIKNVHTVMRFRHTKSIPKFMQEVGRALNPYNDSIYLKGLVFDFMNDINRLYSKPYREFIDKCNTGDVGYHELEKTNDTIRIKAKPITFSEHIDKVIQEVLSDAFCKRFTEKEDNKLLDLFKNNYSIENISEKLNRSQTSIRHRLQTLGVWEWRYTLKTKDEVGEIIKYMKETNGMYIKNHYCKKFGITSRYVTRLGLENNITFAKSINNTGSIETNRLKELIQNGLDTQHLYISEIYEMCGIDNFDNSAKWRIQQYIKSNKIKFKKINMRKYEIVLEYRKNKKLENVKEIVADKFGITTTSVMQSVRKLKDIPTQKLNKIVERGYI